MNKYLERGANEVYTRSGMAKCDVCNKVKKNKELAVAHGGLYNGKDHIYICGNCNMPKGFTECGCGG